MDIIATNKELLKQYPKTLEQLLKWEKGNLILFQEKALEMIEEKEGVSLPEIKDDMVETTVYGTWSLNPRHYYDFFDSVGVIVVPVYAGEGYYYSINGNNSEKYFTTRRDAETAAFEEALKVNENGLS